jgi:GDP-4-dehydro-6-deoxy-D-mannose reductase
VGALITGISGFTGAHLARYLLVQNEQVFGFDQQPIPASAAWAAGIPVHTGDIRDQTTLRQVLADTRPDTIYHLVGLLKSTDAQALYEVNVLGTVSLLESAVELGIAPNVLITSSSAVYGPGPEDRPITERCKPRPFTHYAASKVAQETVAFRYVSAHKLPVVCTRAFNLIGPGQPPTLACSAFARQIALAEQVREAGSINTGNLSAQRDFVDVRDAVRAYELLARRGRPGEVYNVCSGQPVAIEQCLAELLGLAQVPLTATVDPARLQPLDVPVQVGSAAKLAKHTGWAPRIPLQQSLADLLNDWRQRITP